MAVDGDFAIDTTVTDFSHGVMKFFDGEEIGVVAMPIAQFTSPVGGEVVTYNATNDEFELAAAGGGGSWSQIADYEATVAEGSHTLSFTAVDFDDDSMIVLVIDGSATAALGIRMTINNLSAANTYKADGRVIGAGVESITQFSGTFFNLAEAGGGDVSADATFNSITRITLNKSGTNDFAQIDYSMYTDVEEEAVVVGGVLKSAISSISSLEIVTSTSTWKIGTRFTVYKVSRT